MTETIDLNQALRDEWALEKEITEATAAAAETQALLDALPPKPDEAQPQPNPYHKPGRPNSPEELAALNLSQAEFEELDALEEDGNLVERLMKARAFETKMADRLAANAAQQREAERAAAHASDPAAVLRQDAIAALARDWNQLAPHQRKAECEALGLSYEDAEKAKQQSQKRGAR